MGYTDVDKLAINAIRLLAVGSLSHHTFSPPICPTIPSLECSWNSFAANSDRNVLIHLSTGRCYFQIELRTPRGSYGHGPSCPRSFQQDYELQPKEPKMGKPRQICSLVSTSFSSVEMTSFRWNARAKQFPEMPWHKTRLIVASNLEWRGSWVQFRWFGFRGASLKGLLKLQKHLYNWHGTKFLHRRIHWRKIATDTPACSNTLSFTSPGTNFPSMTLRPSE